MRKTLLATIAATSILLTGCLSVSDEGNRITAADEDWGVDMLLAENGVPYDIVIEGREGGVGLPEASWKVTTHRTPDDRPALHIYRDED